MPAKTVASSHAARVPGLRGARGSQAAAVYRSHAALQSRASQFRRERQSRRIAASNADTNVATTDLEEIDPITGQVISRSLRRVAALTATSPLGYTWAYRESGSENTADPPVVLVHGLGSNSFAWRFVMDSMARDGFRVLAPDLLGHGGTSKPDLDYTKEDYIKSMDDFLEAVGLGGDAKISLCVQGYVLSNYALLWAAQNEDRIEKLIILPTPLSLKSKLPPALTAYKAPMAFMRPKGTFKADLWTASGLAYVINRETADGYQGPYEQDEMATTVVERTLEKLDWKQLLAEVDETFRTWRTEGLIIPGGADPLIKLDEPFQWLESKRTCLKGQTLDAKVGNMPQEDYPEPTAQLMVEFLKGVWEPGTKRSA